MDRPRIAGDYHGQAPILWCAYALLNLTIHILAFEITRLFLLTPLDKYQLSGFIIPKLVLFYL